MSEREVCEGGLVSATPLKERRYIENGSERRDVPVSVPPRGSTPIDMVLFCPACGLQHVDAPEPMIAHEMCTQPEFPAWDNPPHRSHLCHGCGHIWRPADVPTNGVSAVKTKGNADSPLHECRAGHKHQWRDLKYSEGSECRHCWVVIPF